MIEKEYRPPLLPGEFVIRPWGRISAVLLTGGERYYMLVNGQGAVALMPADVVEPAYDEQQRGAK